MKKKIIILTIFVSCIFLKDTFGAENFLQDGLAVSGLDGKLFADANGSSYFKISSDLSDGKTTLRAGVNLAMLESIELEKMTDSIRKDPNALFRIWGKLTAYDGRNYIYPIYSLSLSEIPQANIQQKQQQGLAFNEPNDPLNIPQEVLEKLRAKTTIHPVVLQKGFELRQDSIITDRSGYVSIQPGKPVVSLSNLRNVFVFDGLGRGIENVQITALPCKTLEDMLRQQAAEPERLRFKIAGIVTRFKGNNFLLLHRATRLYSYGNFPR
jgi:hypothetical protein